MFKKFLIANMICFICFPAFAAECKNGKCNLVTKPVAKSKCANGKCNVKKR